MFQFPRFPPQLLCVQSWVPAHNHWWVSPFGHPRINRCLALPRGLSQPATSFVGSWRLGIHRTPLLAWCRCSRSLWSFQGSRERRCSPRAAPESRAKETAGPNCCRRSGRGSGRGPSLRALHWVLLGHERSFPLPEQPVHSTDGTETRQTTPIGVPARRARRKTLVFQTLFPARLKPPPRRPAPPAGARSARAPAPAPFPPPSCGPRPPGGDRRDASRRAQMHRARRREGRR